MARKLDNYEFPPSRRRSEINWDEVLDGNIWKLQPDVDFASKPQTVAVNAKKAAAERDKYAHVHITDDGDVVIRAVTK